MRRLTDLAASAAIIANASLTWKPTSVRRKLDQQQEIDVSRVRIDSQNQVVRITGKVRTEDDLNALQDLVLSVRGVMGVDLEAVVDESRAAG